MDIERLTARNKDGIAYLVNVKPDEQEVDSPHKNTLKCILDCFERLAQYEEEAIAHQSVTSEEVAISKTETTKTETVEPCEWCNGDVSQYFDVNWYDFIDGERGNVNHCPNCGRKLTCPEFGLRIREDSRRI